jgi:hypothetical protein
MSTSNLERIHGTPDARRPAFNHQTRAGVFDFIAIDRIAGDRASNDFGMNFGEGIMIGTERGSTSKRVIITR